MWCYSRLLKVPWTEKKNNREIIQMAYVGERLLQQFTKRKLRHAGHIMRGSSGPLLHQSLQGKIEGKRGQRRPRRNWMDDVKGWSGSTSYGDTKRKAENREEWRDMVANLRDRRRHLTQLTIINDLFLADVTLSLPENCPLVLVLKRHPPHK
ncbi:eukaryotic translation initiation factor 3 subunit F [Elysia marginata]|uniref:Eukaryotic translation initiation factor 3 subunit F n=1 Tax=Elysia marginata TaxID=1093978 RepID=A0AAV4JLU7_9GAST|nr:eukaryotic translation initiation factor 3 subunit F [Elysia marginata]